jgi:hypothetical protein
MFYNSTCHQYKKKLSKLTVVLNGIPNNPFGMLRGIGP